MPPGCPRRARKYAAATAAPRSRASRTAPLGLGGPGGLAHAVAHGGHLGEDRDGDLRWGLGTDVEPDRPAQARDLIGRDVEFLQPLAARVVVLLGPNSADVERGGFQRLHQR